VQRGAFGKPEHWIAPVVHRQDSEGCVERSVLERQVFRHPLYDGRSWRPLVDR
jgi:hypothetical protein